MDGVQDLEPGQDVKIWAYGRSKVYVTIVKVVDGVVYAKHKRGDDRPFKLDLRRIVPPREDR